MTNRSDIMLSQTTQLSNDRKCSYWYKVAREMYVVKSAESAVDCSRYAFYSCVHFSPRPSGVIDSRSVPPRTRPTAATAPSATFQESKLRPLLLHDRFRSRYRLHSCFSSA